MPVITVVDLNGNEHQVDAVSGSSLMQEIRGAGFDELLALCGGSCACGTCHVYVEDAAVTGKRSFNEGELLELSAHLKETSRLSCQIEVTDAMEGMRVVIAPHD